MLTDNDDLSNINNDNKSVTLRIFEIQQIELFKGQLQLQNNLIQL